VASERQPQAHADKGLASATAAPSCQLVTINKRVELRAPGGLSIETGSAPIAALTIAKDGKVTSKGDLTVAGGDLHVSGTQRSRAR